MRTRTALAALPLALLGLASTATALPGVSVSGISVPDVPTGLPEACHTWVPANGSLQLAVDTHQCVAVPRGTHVLDRALRVPGGHLLRGVEGAARNEVVLLARRNAPWPQEIGVVKSAPPYERPVTITGITVDGNSQRKHSLQGRADVRDGAHVGISAPSMIVHDVEVRNARCVGISAYEDLVSLNLFTTVITVSTIHSNGFECTKAAAPPGAGIYIHPVGDATDRVIISGNTIRDNDGSGVDLDGVDGGVLSGNTITDNSKVDGFAAISLVDASNWVISGNTASNPRGRGKVNCPGGPAGSGASALFMCARNRDVTGNVVVGNSFSSHYAILVNRVRGHAVGNVLRDNTVSSTSKVRCGEGNPVDANTWQGNNCQTGAVATASSEPPVYFTPGKKKP
ncbi:MAG: right-handed parallel beta-helix repeat-containing protein [Mycobacteriales bacterium]|nr:right-handed parallel beta-helix repeat-containing protein [Mycobacteriales bacterium]